MGKSLAKGAVGVACGVLIAMLAYWFASAVALLLLHGLPLGSGAGGAPTSGDSIAQIALAAAACYGGAAVSVRVAGHHPTVHALLTGGLVGVFMAFGFSKPTSLWPAWFAYAMALACVCGAWLARYRRL